MVWNDDNGDKKGRNQHKLQEKRKVKYIKIKLLNEPEL